MINNDFVGGIICGAIGICALQISGIPFGTCNWWLLYACYVIVAFYIKILIKEFGRE